MNPRFECCNLCRHYLLPKSYGINSGLFSPLKNINLSIPNEGITALTGRNGSGKSTLARILMRLEPFQRGEIFYKGEPLNHTPLKQFRRDNQIMFQSPLSSVNPYFRIKKILAEPLIINIPGIRNEQIQQSLLKWMDFCELPPEYLNRFPNELSGGQLQRIVLARTFILEPEFVILDEPFCSLDEPLAERLMRLFKKILMQMGTAVLFISHHSGQVAFFADQVIHLAHIR